MRIIALMIAILLLPGCALLPFYESRSDSSQAVADALSRASLDAPRYATAQGPVGLAPCQKKRFPARNCWRKGDEHVVYPASASIDLFAYDSSGPVTVSEKH